MTNRILSTLDKMPKEQVDIHLRYEGPDVEDGTMSLQDIVPVLQGFSGAYAKLAKTDDPNSIHRVKIAAVRSGSADIVLEVWKTVVQNSEQIAAAFSGGAASFGIISKIIQVIQIKRHVKASPFEHSISANNGIAIVNSDNVNFVMQPPVYELFASGLLNRNLDQLTRPLAKDQIDAAEIQANWDNQELRERITVDERPYFEYEDEAFTSTLEMQYLVHFTSLFKNTNSGHLNIQDGTRVSYRYLGEDPQELHYIFGTHGGSVQVRCKANLGENLRVKSLDILEIVRVQAGLFDAPTGDTKEDTGQAIS